VKKVLLPVVILGRIHYKMVSGLLALFFFWQICVETSMSQLQIILRRFYSWLISIALFDIM
jgi:hypothetical protein